MGNCIACKGKDELGVSQRTHKEMAIFGDHDHHPSASQTSREPDPYMEEWKLADSESKGKLDFNEILSILKKLNVPMRSGLIKYRLRRADKDGNGLLNFKEFCNFLDNLRTRPEIKAIFDQFSHPKHYITAEKMLLFLHQEQFETSADTGEALRIIRKYENSQVATKLYFSGFSAFMQSQENSGYNHSYRANTYQRMDLPMPMYYIASSHNTYIESHQLKGNSSVEAYISALKRGCKCVELDIWDGDDGQPIITHGHTMTSRIKFRDVVVAIKDHAFDYSPYPVILSLENHCSEKQQIRMAEIFTEILAAGFLPDHLLDMPNPLPSPEQLKNKILIKGKVLSQTPLFDDDEFFDEDDDDQDIFEEYEDMGGEATKGLDLTQLQLEAFGDSSSSGGSTRSRRKSQRYSTRALNLNELGEMTPNNLKLELSPKVRASRRYSVRQKTPKPPKVTVAKELSDMMHLKPVAFQGFQNAKDKNAPWEMSSFSELKVQNFFKFELDGLIEIYPKGTRFDSSNYPPMISWAGGCQLTSLNYQTDGAPMWLNAAKFLDNGGIGYVLKPSTLLTTAKPDPYVVRKTLHVHLISGWQLPKEASATNGEVVVNPYVKIKMYGVPGDNKKYRTKVVQNDGFNPQWDEHVSFEMARSDLAQVLFEVFDQDRSKDSFLGYASVPVPNIKQGYRNLQMYDSKSVPIPNSSLFVQWMLT